MTLEQTVPECTRVFALAELLLQRCHSQDANSIPVGPCLFGEFLHSDYRQQMNQVIFQYLLAQQQLHSLTFPGKMMFRYFWERGRRRWRHGSGKWKRRRIPAWTEVFPWWVGGRSSPPHLQVRAEAVKQQSWPGQLSDEDLILTLLSFHRFLFVLLFALGDSHCHVSTAGETAFNRLCDTGANR